ncbi:beta-ketoacyl synthase N-terminal-like domain-containing protein, partial [Microbispora rosea]
ALVAADLALADANVSSGDADSYGMGVVTASSAGGFEFGQRELQNLWRHGSRHVSAYQSFAWFYAVNTGQISIRHGLRGPSGVVVTDQAGGLDTVAQARRLIRKGTGLVLAGGVDGSICPWGWVAQMAGGRLSRCDDPRLAYLPFDARAAGHVPGEGGAILVLEDAEAAARRGAGPGYGEIAGYGTAFDPRPGSGGAPALPRAMELAVRDAGLSPGDIDVVFADGAAVPALDRIEADAITAMFGAGRVPVTVPKTMTGRLYAGGAALDLATALLCLRDGVIPPTINVTPEAAYGLDLVTGLPRTAPVRTALIVARGEGGFNSAMVVRRPDDE